MSTNIKQSLSELIGAIDYDFNIFDTIINKNNFIYNELKPELGISPIYAVRENYIITFSPSILYFYENGFQNPYTTALDFNSTNFPNLSVGDSINKIVLFLNDASDIRTLLFTSKNKIYYSDGQIFGNFKESSVWTMPGESFKHPLESDLDPDGVRYRFNMPSDYESRGDFFTWLNGDVDNNRGYKNGFIFGNYSTATGQTGVPSSLFFTTNGKDIYIEYMFGIKGYRIKRSGTSTFNYQSLYNLGENLDTSGITDIYSNGLTLKRRTTIVPSSVDKEPIDIFEYTIPVSVTAFSKANPAVCTVSDSTGIVAGDIVIFEGDSGSVEWNAFVNPTTDTSGLLAGGNGRIYQVKAVTGNDLTLTETLGNPHNNLICRHIHSVNEFANGLVIGTGEVYPESWQIFLKTIPYIASSDTWITGNSYRLNSSELGMQRTLGMYFRSDNKIVWGSDTAESYETSITINGRSDIFKINYLGAWVGNLSDIDDRTKFNLVLPGVSSCYTLRKMGSGIYFISQKGEIFISLDEGNSWEHVSSSLINNFIPVGFDKDKNRWWFPNGRSLEFKK